MVLGNGKLLQPRIVTVPPPLGGGRVWIAAVPRGRAVRAVRVPGRREQPLWAPAARDQCGFVARTEG